VDPTPIRQELVRLRAEDPVSGGRARRVAAAAAFALRHPKRAYRLIYHSAAPAPPSEASDADRFDLALHLLTGLDVSLTFERDGLVWTVPPGEDGIGEDLFRTGTYSGATIDAVRAFVTKHRPGCQWIVDVGANIGTTTIPFARAGFQVVAIEPVPAVLRYLRRNLEANDLADRVRVFENAVAPGSGEVLIATSTSFGNSEVVSTASSAAGLEARYRRAETIRVPGLGLGDAVDAVGVPPESIALVWSDTQGSETAVIETGTALWAAGVPLFAEFWPGGLASKGGVDAFIDQAGRHFRQFIDGANDGRLIVENLETGAARAEPRPVAELSDLAEEVAGYPGQFTDVLLLP